MIKHQTFITHQLKVQTASADNRLHTLIQKAIGLGGTFQTNDFSTGAGPAFKSADNDGEGYVEEMPVARQSYYLSFFFPVDLLKDRTGGGTDSTAALATEVAGLYHLGQTIIDKLRSYPNEIAAVANEGVANLEVSKLMGSCLIGTYNLNNCTLHYVDVQESIDEARSRVDLDGFVLRITVAADSIA